MIKAVQSFIHRFGFEIRKVENFHLKRNREVNIQLGKFSLAVNTRNPISIHYSRHPNYGSELARLSKAIFQKYPSLNVIDIGANIGDTAAIVKNSVDVPMICIEGDAYCFSFLEKNITQFQNVLAFNQFLGEKDETIPARLEKSSWNTTIIPDPQGDSASLQLNSFDTFASKNSLTGTYKLIKIDTEGFDVKIMRGASGFIDAQKPVIYFEYNRHNMNQIGEEGIDTLLWLKDKGYRHILFYEDGGQFILSASLEDNHVIRQLHHWIGKSKGVYYFDLVVFHESDNDIAEKFIQSEETK